MLEEGIGTEALGMMVGLSLAAYDNQDIKERDPGYGIPVKKDEGWDIIEGEDPVVEHFLDTNCNYNN